MIGDGLVVLLTFSHYVSSYTLCGMRLLMKLLPNFI